ncbi:MAG: hypothetical protein U5K29_02400 [Acidimicrobiales bacterium]|nr:hypothetical protein [Acidimicrobiales bacterium]
MGAEAIRALDAPGSRSFWGAAKQSAASGACEQAGVALSVPVQSRHATGEHLCGHHPSSPRRRRLYPGETTTIELDLFGHAPTDGYRLVWDAQPVFHPDRLQIDVRLGDQPLVAVETTGNRDLELTDAGGRPG